MVVVSKKNINQWLKEGNALDQSHIESLEKFTEEYPHYGPTQALLAKAYFNVNSDYFELQLRKAALTNDDRVWLYDFIHNSTQAEEKAKPEKKTKEKKVTVKAKAKRSVAQKKVPKKDVKQEQKVTEAKAKSEKTNKPRTTKPKVKKIQISQGEGEVTAQLSQEQEVLNALPPKLRVDETPFVEKQIEENPEQVTKNSQKPTDNSFLDWLDYTNLNESDEKAVPIVQSEKTIHFEETQGKMEKADEPENNVSKTLDLLANFIANKPKPGEIKLESYDPEEKSLASDSAEHIPVSESLAEVYISQNEVEMAMEVYEKLMLKFPEKRAYFADLIQKLNKE